MGWLIAVGILVLLAITPVGVYAAYNSEGIFLRIIAGPARITILPKKEKKAKQQDPKPPKEKAVKSANTASTGEKKQEKVAVSRIFFRCFRSCLIFSGNSVENFG